MNLPPKIGRSLKDDPIILFDVGAKGGASELLRLAPWVNGYGFEPHPESFAALEYTGSPYARQHYFPYALSEIPGRRMLRLAKHSSYSSFLPVDWHTHRRHLQLMPLFEKWKNDMQTERELEVEVSTLSHLVDGQRLSGIDFLKLDSQGTELPILKGGTSLLEKGAIGLVKCEVSFIPFYKGQCLFADVDFFLRSYGYRFIDCLFYPDMAYQRKSKHFNPAVTARERPHFGMGGDAIYYRPVEKGHSSSSVLKKGVLLAALGYYSPAYETLLKCPGLSRAEIDELFKSLAQRPLPARVKSWAKQWLPLALLKWLR